jgi:hypothetical protein
LIRFSAVATGLLAVVYSGAPSLLVGALFCSRVYVFHRFSSSDD